MSEEALFFRRTQVTKYTHVYSITLQMLSRFTVGGIPSPIVNVEPILQIMEDADFHITHMTGSVSDPVDASGIRVANPTGSDYLMTFPMAGSPNRGGRGIFFKFLDPELNRPLQVGQPSNDAVIKAAQFLSVYDQTMLDFTNVFSVGYGMSWGKPIKFDYTLMKNKRLKILLQNRQAASIESTEVQTYVRVSMAFIGHRYEV